MRTFKGIVRTSSWMDGKRRMYGDPIYSAELQASSEPQARAAIEVAAQNVVDLEQTPLVVIDIIAR
jgi:hypothetical protein